jgi:nucleotide-binding universal stress UspA family protein
LVFALHTGEIADNADTTVGGFAMKETIVWAIDPYEKGNRPEASIVRKLIGWLNAANLQIQPVFVIAGPESVHAISIAEATADDYLLDLGVMENLPVKVIPVEASTRKKEVDALLAFASRQRSTAILVSSHGRSGSERFLLGSFAENLLHRSKCPVLFLNQLNLWKEKKEIPGRALFATDFSNHSHEAFLQFLSQAKHFKFDVVIFNAVSLPTVALMSGYGTPIMIPEDYFLTQTNSAKEEAANWVQQAKNQGVTATYVVEDGGIGPQIPSMILRTAEKEGAELIVMASASGAVSSLVLGSVAREVFRCHHYPVWVYGPGAIEKKPSASVQPKSQLSNQGVRPENK